MNPIRILRIKDQITSDAHISPLQRCPWDCTFVASANTIEEGLSVLDSCRDQLDAVLFDQRTNKPSRLNGGLSRVVRSAYPVPVVALTDKLDRSEVGTLLNSGVADVIFRCHLQPGHICRVVHAAASLRRREVPSVTMKAAMEQEVARCG